MTKQEVIDKVAYIAKAEVGYIIEDTVTFEE